jgi:hypothetical protein
MKKAPITAAVIGLTVGIAYLAPPLDPYYGYVRTGRVTRFPDILAIRVPSEEKTHTSPTLQFRKFKLSM